MRNVFYRDRAVELAKEIATRHGFSSHHDLIPIEGRRSEKVAAARGELVRCVNAEYPKLSSVQIAGALGCHHTTVLFHLGRVKNGSGDPSRHSA